MLFGVVLWAATQLAESSRIENSVALAFIAVSRLRCDLASSIGTLGGIVNKGNPVDSLGLYLCSRTAILRKLGKNLRGIVAAGQLL